MRSNQLEQWAARVRSGQPPDEAAAEVRGDDELEPRPLTGEQARAGATAIAACLRAAGLSPDRATERARNIATALLDGVEPPSRTIREMIRPTVVDECHIRAAARAWCQTTRPDELHVVVEADSPRGYVAYDDASYEAGEPIGRGSTRQGAVEDLIVQLADHRGELEPTAEPCTGCES